MSAESIPGFIRITQVVKRYDINRKTLERRRDKARQQGNAAVYGMFRLRTRDGEVFDQPTLEQVKELRASGRVPEWYVSRQWIEKEFGDRRTEQSRQRKQGTDNSANASTDAVIQLRQQYEATIELLKQQIADEKQDKRQLLERAQQDKQMFANVASRLAQALPALEAVNPQPPAQQQPQASSPPPKTAATPKESSKNRASDRSSPKRTRRKRRFFRRVFFG